MAATEHQSAPDTGQKRSVGRPRHYDEATERELVFDAGYRVLRDHGDTGLTIADVLAEAGVSTRSFYRHFASKDELLCAMFNRDAERSAARLDSRLASATSPLQAVQLWIDGIFGFKVGQRAERLNVLGSLTISRAEGAAAVIERSQTLLIAPLATAIAAGAADGTFTTTQPAADAEMVAAVVFHGAGLVSPHLGTTPHPTARDEVLSFCLRALGVPA